MTSTPKLPSHWLSLLLGEVAEVVAGGTPKASDHDNFAEPGTQVAWLTPADLSKYTQKYIAHGARDLSAKGYEASSAKLLPAGTILFSSRAPIGYVAIAENQISTSQGFKNFVLPTHIDPSYAYYFLRSIRHIAESMGTGTTFKEISGTKAKALPFTLAPLDEQKAIADKLDTLLAQVEITKARLDRIPQILKRFRQSVLAAAVTGRLTLEIEPWQLKTLGECFQCIDGDRGPNYPKKHEYSDTGYCLFLSTKNVRPFGFDFTEQVFISKEKDELLRKGRLSRGDLVLTTRGTLGHVASYDESVPFDKIRINSGMLILRKKNSDFCNDYFKILIASPLFRKHTADKRTGSAQPQLPAKVLKGFKLPVPSVREQTRIVDRVAQLFAHADLVEKQIQAALERVNNLTQSILAKAFCGDLTEQWRKDNPELVSGQNSASALLERIKTERTAQAPRKLTKKKRKAEAVQEK